jgi:membrane-associated phospholipid phosphatase
VSRSEAVASAALVTALLFCAFPEALLPLDAAVYRVVQFHRTCGVQAAVGWLDWLARAALGVAVLAGLGRGRIPRASFWIGLVALIVGGAAAGEVLKTVFERMRPNEAPGDLSGNSFPSGHIMNTTLVAVALCALAVEAGSSRVLRGLAIVMASSAVGIQAVFRLVNGSHWASDVPASIVLAIGWMAGASALWRRRPLSILPLILAAGVIFVLFYENPAIRIRLPSVLEQHGALLAAVDARDPSLRGRWSGGWREPIGSVAWALEPTVRMAVPPIATEAPVVARIVLRPPGSFEGARGCTHVVLGLGSWETPPIALLEGWREYHVPLAPDAVARNAGEIRMLVLDDLRESGSRAPGMLAFHRLRVESD